MTPDDIASIVAKAKRVRPKPVIVKSPETGRDCYVFILGRGLVFDNEPDAQQYAKSVESENNNLTKS